MTAEMPYSKRFHLSDALLQKRQQAGIFDLTGAAFDVD